MWGLFRYRWRSARATQRLVKKSLLNVGFKSLVGLQMQCRGRIGAGALGPTQHFGPQTCQRTGGDDGDHTHFKSQQCHRRERSQ